MLTVRLRRFLFAAVAVSLVTLGSSAFVTASSTRPAGATCTGVGQPQVITRYDAQGTLVAEEAAPYPGSTCNGDSQYTGLVLDPVTDGSCAYVYYLEPLAYYALQGASCTTGSWSLYSYSDSIGTNSVFVSTRPSYLSDDWKLSYGY
jgi:hypothetical protein